MERYPNHVSPTASPAEVVVGRDSSWQAVKIKTRVVYVLHKWSPESHTTADRKRRSGTPKRATTQLVPLPNAPAYDNSPTEKGESIDIIHPEFPVH